jgi:hypothetical protein
MDIPPLLQVLFPAALKAIKEEDFWTALDILARIELRVFKLALAETRVKKQ